MNNLSSTVFDSYQVRKTKKQKDDFISLIKEHYPEAKVETGGISKSRNIVIGDVDNAKMVFGAHYDTCSRLPFPNFLTPKNFFIYLLYNILIVMAFFVISFIGGAGIGALASLLSLPVEIGELVACILYFALLFMMFCGKPNQHTANDNTSGVVTLLELLENMSEEARSKVAFVFFDNEENGLLGSGVFRKQHKEAMKTKPLINFDCVSDGDYIMFVSNKKARNAYEETLRKAFSDKKCDGKTVLFEKSNNTLYPSDQMNFPLGIGVASFKKSKLCGLYMDKIHTKNDTVFDEQNINYLCRVFSDIAERI